VLHCWSVLPYDVDSFLATGKLVPSLVLSFGGKGRSDWIPKEPKSCFTLSFEFGRQYGFSPMYSDSTLERFLEAYCEVLMKRNAQKSTRVIAMREAIAAMMSG